MASLVAIARLGLVAGPASAEVTIDWVLVGDPGNAPDTPSTNCYAGNCGAVTDPYLISKYEVTNAQYAEFLNAKAAADPNGLYHTEMASDALGGITRSGSSGSYSYAVKPGFADKPVVLVSYWDSVRFTNWLANGQGNGDTETGSYTLTPAGIAANSVTRNPGAVTFLPSESEWYKAAFYGGGGVYFDYPTGTDAVIGCVAPPEYTGNPDTGNSANCFPAFPQPPGALTDVGAYALSDSPFGTYDQGGNVWEWNETIMFDSYRGSRGGSWVGGADLLDTSIWQAAPPAIEDVSLGFRVASRAPECSDGSDNDGDGAIDFPADPGCFDAASIREDPACDDGIDNDGDGRADWDGAGVGPADGQCIGKPWRRRETCGLGAELALVLPMLQWVHRRRRTG